MNRRSNKNKTIALSVTDSNQISRYSIVDNAMMYLLQAISQDNWLSRPRYDEDAGVFVNNQDYDPFRYCCQFAIVSLAESIRDRLLLTDAEEAEYYKIIMEQENSAEVDTTDKKQLFTVSREFSCTELPFICQGIFFYLKNIDDIYAQKERDLYESDTHYSGKPLQHFLDRAKDRAMSDRREILKIAKFFGDQSLEV